MGVVVDTAPYWTAVRERRNVFRNPRGEEGYYGTYHKEHPTTNTNEYYGRSTNGTSFTTSQITTKNDDEGFALCFYEDATNSQTVVYGAHNQNFRDLLIRRGTIADSSDEIVWSDNKLHQSVC